MNIRKHLLVSMVVAAVSLLFNQNVPFFGVELFGHSITVFVLSMAVGIFVDVDHIIDYHLNRGHIFGSLESRFRTGKMYVIFHGIENVILFTGL